MRDRTAIAGNAMHNVRTRIKVWRRSGGSTKLGMTPGGGAIAGPSSKTCSAAAVEAITDLLFALLRSQMEAGKEERVEKTEVQKSETDSHRWTR